jgi:hypothetical protein
MGGGEHGARGRLAQTRRGFCGVFGATEDVAYPPLGDRARDPYGGAAFLGTAASDGVGTKMDQRPGLASRVAPHACCGARLCEGVAARTDARERARDVNATRTRQHGTAATKTGRRPTARGVG